MRKLKINKIAKQFLWAGWILFVGCNGLPYLDGPPTALCKDGETEECFPDRAGCFWFEDSKSYVCYGECKTGKRRCAGGNWGECAEVTLRVKEVCDGKDNDCNGLVDEGCGCVDGTTQACQIPSERCDQDSSKNQQKCENGKWAEKCTPPEELCNGKDDNCDGKIDNTFPEKGKPCVISEGQNPCQKGVYGCAFGQLFCNPENEEKELCNRIDDNCNGLIDEGCECKEGTIQDCRLPTSACGQSFIPKNQQKCENGKWAEKCPTPEELCNGKDDNCDGRVDDTFPEKGKPCMVPEGQNPCQKGFYGCAFGKLYCDPENGKEELCNKIDDNCNGLVDEGCPCKEKEQRYCLRFSVPRIGICKKTGLQICFSTTWSHACKEQQMPLDEQCDSAVGYDDNCDGKIDEHCTCKEGQIKQCYAGAKTTHLDGLCKAGMMVCTKEGIWGECKGSIEPIKEICNNQKDDNCDGEIDENCP